MSSASSVEDFVPRLPTGVSPLDPTGGSVLQTPTLFCGVQKILKLYYGLSCCY